MTDPRNNNPFQSSIKRRFANPGESVYYNRRYAICNEFGPIAFVHADCEQDAIDEAADSGKLDSEKMSEADYLEYDTNGWNDSFILAGNASEPFWAEYLTIRDVTRV